MATILLVDDDHHILEVLRFALEQENHKVLVTSDGREALRIFGENQVDLLLLDVVMPQMSGLSLCREIRAQSHVPIVFLSSRDDESDKVLGLELGGDDYITKPFSPRELVARVAAALRRANLDQHASKASAKSWERGPLRIDEEAHRVFVNQSEIHLTAAEFSLLLALAQRPGRVYSRPQLVELAFGTGHHLTDRTVDSHVRGIRKKLKEAGEMIETVYGVGYRLRDEA